MSSLPEYGIVVRCKGAFIPLQVGHYPAGEPYIKNVPQNVDAIILRPLSMDVFMAGLFLVHALTLRQGAVDLVLPYVPGLRQDRLLQDETSDQLFTALSVAKILDQIEAKSIRILDPHSSFVQWKNIGVTTKVFQAPFILGRYWDKGVQMMFEKNYAGVIAPDKGSVERAKLVADYLEIGRIFCCEKKRDPSTGKLIGFEVEDPGWYGNRPYLVVDDICDGGGTFLGIADEYQRLGYINKLDLLVSHGIFSKGTGELLSKYGTIYTSDSVLNNRFNGVTVLPTVERML